MAGSFNHIVADDGTFTISCIENLGDAHEALEECFELVGTLLAAYVPEPFRLVTLNQALTNIAAPTVETLPKWQGRVASYR